MLATNPVRIAAAPQILTARAGVAGQRGQKVIPATKGTITLSSGMVRGAVLLKAENGQLQVVNIAGSSGNAIPGATTYRLQSISTGATTVRTVTPQQLVTVPVSATNLKTNQVTINGSLATPINVNTTSANSQQSNPTQLRKNVKIFLSTLIRLADEQPANVAKSVRNLIQGIIDGSMGAEEFTSRLQKELNSAPQPYLIPFLKKNLPFLRHSLITKGIDY
ncbi:transcription initiation factor TFIID subunit 4 [Caerostris extrusa]|uniref:Transcription initiation factor TFIID subunit 4 n=1 Tax=Caerostris extrusa TaxID=172846 RepID=A0AAV4XF45_CAEEX|nr:transcription initiation factor TFIID subunit 4 [Caerostris extrusa]